MTKEKILRDGIAHALDLLTEEVDHYDDDSGSPPRELEFIRRLSAHLNGTLIEASLASAAEPRSEQRMVPVCTGCNSFPCVCNILADLHRAPAGGLMPFTHWSKDPLVPYTGCTCSSCEDMREYLSMASDSTSPTR